jgi:hypothetical protein
MPQLERYDQCPDTCPMAPSHEDVADMSRFCMPTKTKLARMLLPAWISGVGVLSSENGQTLHTGDLMDDLACVIGQRDDCSKRLRSSHFSQQQSI